MKTTKFLSTLIIAGGVAFSATMAASAFAQPTDKPTHDPAAQPDTGAKKHEKGEKKDEKKATKGVKVGDAAPDFKLTDTDGKTVSLADFKGKVVMIEWFNPECPFIVKHHKVNTTFNDMFTKFQSKGVVFLAINSSAAGKEGAGKEVNAKYKTEYKMQYPILLDESGTVGHAYGATNTPHCFVIGADGKIAYMGAIDNNTDMKKAGDKNYVAMALDYVINGKPADPAQTKPYGCGVKYGN